MKLLISSILVFETLVSSGQDRITLTNGKEYEVRIIDETSDFVRFSVIDSPDKISQVPRSMVRSILRDRSSTNYEGLKDEVRAMLLEIEGKWSLDEFGYISYKEIVEIPETDQAALYSRAENFFAYYYQDANEVMQTENKEEGIIIGKGATSLPSYNFNFAAGISYTEQHFLRIDVKDSRVRITYSISSIIGELNSVLSIERDTPISNFYPVYSNPNSRYNSKRSITNKEKNTEAQAFYHAHKHATAALQSAVIYMETGAMEDSDW